MSHDVREAPVSEHPAILVLAVPMGGVRLLQVYEPLHVVLDRLRAALDQPENNQFVTVSPEGSAGAEYKLPIWHLRGVYASVEMPRKVPS